MKKILLLLTFVATTIAVNAQTRFGVKAGLNVSTMSMDNGSYGVDNKMIPGFHIGVVADRGLGGNLYLQPGLLLSTKGAKYEMNDNEVKYKTTYLELPINLGYKVAVSKLNLLFAGGPYFAYAIAGNIRTHGLKNNINWGSGTGKDLKPFEVGLNLSAGVEIQKIQLSLQYGFGFNNIAANSGTSRNSGLAISAAYIF